MLVRFSCGYESSLCESLSSIVKTIYNLKEKIFFSLFSGFGVVLNLSSSINRDFESLFISSFSSILPRFLRINLKHAFFNSSISCLSATINMSITLSFLNCLQRYLSHKPLRPFITYSSTTGIKSKANFSSSSTSLQ